MNNSAPSSQARLTREQIESAARETFAIPPGNQALQPAIESTLNLVDSFENITREQLRIGFQFGEVVAEVTAAFIKKFGDSSETRREAEQAAIDFLSRRYGISPAAARLYLHAHQKFHSRPDAVKFLRLSDMQLLLGRHISEPVIDAVIRQRAATPAMSTHDVSALIDGLLRDETGTTGQTDEPGASPL